MQTEPPTLSVVLPNYNHATFLPRALDALVAQEPPPDEIIVVDDGSTDDSLAVIRDYAGRCPAIRLVAHERNQGAIPALQHGLEAARGTYVYFAAADDWVLPGFFARARAMLAAHPAAGLFCGDAVLVDAATGRVTGHRPIARPLARGGAMTGAEAQALLKTIDNWILTGSAVFRRRSVLAAGGFEPRLGALADGMLGRKVALTEGFCYAPVPAATRCLSAQCLSRVTALRHGAAVLRTAPGLIAADPAFPSWYPALFARRWRFATARLALESWPPDHDLLDTMGPRSTWARRLLAAGRSSLPPPAARLATLAALWFLLRPTSLRRVIASAAARRRPRRRGWRPR